MRNAESNHRVGMTGLDPYSMVTLIYRLSRARNFLLQSSAKLTTGIPRANQKPTQDCLSRLQDSLSWLGLGAHEGYQWCQQTTSMRFQALRSCTKPQTSWGSGEGGGGVDLLDWLALQHIRGIQFYVRFLERWLSLKYILILSNYRKRMGKSRFSKNWSRTSLHSRFSVLFLWTRK